jgi:hypothetical protein
MTEKILKQDQDDDSPYTCFYCNSTNTVELISQYLPIDIQFDINCNGMIYCYDCHEVTYES